MKTRMLGRLLMAAALLVGAAAASTKESANLPHNDSDIAANVRHEVLMYPATACWTTSVSACSTATSTCWGR